MASDKTFHMTPEEFRRHGHAVVDWIADYYGRIESYPVLSRAQPGQIRASLPADPPAQGEPFPAILADIEKLILPGITHWQSPNFYAYFPSNASGPAILGDLLSSGLGVQGMLWATSPACTELETHVLDWLVHMLGLPQKFLSTSSGGGVIQDTASSASLCALLAARERATNFASNQRGCDGKLVAYTSSQAHSSLEKGAQIAGIGRDNLRLIEVDDAFAMRPEALARQIEQDRRAGLVPFFVCATVGTTSSNAIDPVPRDCPHLQRAQTLAARGRCHVRHGRALSGIPPHPRRTRICRQLLLQSPQVDVHQFRLRLLLRRGPQGPDPDLERTAGILAQPSHRIRRRDRLSRLADSARTPLSGTQAVVRDPALWGRRLAAPHPAARRMGAAVSPVG